MAKGLSAAKAKKILKDGYVKGKPLTAKQKKYFGAIANGATPLKAINGGWLDKYQDGGDVPKAQGGTILKLIKNMYKGTDKVVDAANTVKKTDKVVSNSLNPLEIADQIIPRFNVLGPVGGDIMQLSPLNAIPFYGKNLKGKNMAFRKFGNSIYDVIQRQALSPVGGSDFRMGKNQIVSEGNWAAMSRPSENYSGVFEATFDFNNPFANLSPTGISQRNGVLITDKLGNRLTEIPLTEPGLSFNRRLPFSTRYVPIDKQKLIDDKSQLATFGPRLQSLAEKYGIGLLGAHLVGEEDTYNKYTIDPIIENTEKVFNDLKKMKSDDDNKDELKDGGWLDKFGMGGSLPGASGMMYSRNSGTTPEEPKKAQNGKVIDWSKQRKKYPGFMDNFKDEIEYDPKFVDFDSVRRAVRNVESLDGKLMWNPESTATGLYGQRFSEIKNDYSGTRKDFVKDTVAQNEFFKRRFYDGLEASETTPLLQDANDLYNDYSSQIKNFPYSKEDIAVLSNFIGRGGTRKYLGYAIRDGKPLAEALPNVYGPSAKQSNKTPEEYLELARQYYKTNELKNGGRCWPGYKTVSGKTPFSKGSCQKAQDGTVEYGTPEYKKAYEEGTLVKNLLTNEDVYNPLDEVVMYSGVDYEKYPYYNDLSAEQRKYFKDDGPIGRGVRRAAYTKKGLAEDTYDVVNPIMYGALALAGGMAAGPGLSTLARAAAPYVSRYALNPIQNALRYKPLGGPVSIGNTIDVGSAAYAAYATPEAYDKFKENPSFDTALDLGLTAMDLVPFGEIFTGGKNIRKAYNYTSDQLSNIFRAKPKGINLETTPLRDAVTQPNIFPTNSPLSPTMEPYLSRRVYPFNKEQEVFESFLSTDRQLNNIDSKSLYYNQAGKRITKGEADNLLYPPEYQKNGGDVDKAQYGRLLKWGKDIYDGIRGVDNVVDVANTVRKTSKVVDNAWAVKPLPGLHLKSTMDNGAISKIIESKTGLINTEQALAIINKESGGAEKVALIRQQLGDNIPKKMDYNNFRTKTQESLIPLEVKINYDGNSDYGLENIGYDPWKIEHEALTISNRNQFGTGSSMHDNPDDTLGHVHFLKDADNPNTLTITQIQSDAFQGGKSTKETKEQLQKSLSLNKKHAEAQRKLHDLAVQDPNSRVWTYPDGQQLTNSMYNEVMDGQNNWNKMQQASIDNYSQKQLLGKNHEERYLQEIVNYAGANGNNKIRIPTMETAAKVQGFNDMQQNMGVLKKYKNQPKTIKKLYGQDVITVTDSKGNTWYEFDIPESFKSGKGEIKAFKEGGSTPKAQVGWLSKYENGGVIEDDRGQWAYPGEITKINSNNITMKGVNYPVLGISDTGDKKMMQPGKDYKFDGNSVTEYPMAKDGKSLVELNQLTNFTNYNTPQPGGWLNKYN